MAYYSTHGISQFLLNNEKQRVRFLLAHPVDALDVLCAQLTRDLFVIAKFLSNFYVEGGMKNSGFSTNISL